MEKTKLKKTRTVHLTHPASYFQSWNQQPQLYSKKCHGRSANFFNCPKRTIESPRAWSQSIVRGPDPTAPHLKYGVFPKKRPSSTRAWSESLVRGPDPTVPHLKYGMFPNKRPSSSRAISNTPHLKPYHNARAQDLHSPQLAQDIPNKKTDKKKPPKKVLLTNPPIYVYRNGDKRHTRQLCLSEMMHVDIKPKRIVSVSPSYCPSPSYKILSPKLTVSTNSRSPAR